MGRKKKKFKPIIFCYYCDRTFENEKVLIQHQRAKHFKCVVCHKRLGSAHGMMVHVFQVHKQQIDKVPHAKEGRDSFHIDIFGMSNIPQPVIDEKHTERGEPPAKRQKLDNQQNPLIVDNVNIPQPQRSTMNPMFPNPMMNSMMNPIMMNPMMMGMFGGMNKPPMAPPPLPQQQQQPHPPPNIPYNPYITPHPHQHHHHPPPPNIQTIPHPPNTAQFVHQNIMYNTQINNMGMPQPPYAAATPQPNNAPTMPPPQNNNVINATNAVQNGDGNIKQNDNHTQMAQSQNVAKKKDKKHNLLYNNELISMEEQRFLDKDYHWTQNGDQHQMDENQDVDLNRNNNNVAL